MMTNEPVNKKRKKKDAHGDDGGHDAAAAAAAPRRYMRRMGDVQGAAAYGWLTTFTDVIALMLTFFVLLFSMTDTKTEDFEEVSTALQAGLSADLGGMFTRGPEEAMNISKIDFGEALNIPYLSALFESVKQSSKLLEGMTLTRYQGELVISLPQELLFDTGSAEVKSDGARALYALGGVLSKIRNKIEITGHADPQAVEPGGEGYDSNWELSLARAANVAAILEKVGYQKDITIRGHSSGRYEDLSKIAEEEQRLALSRRVDIVLMNHDGSKRKVFFDNADE